MSSEWRKDLSNVSDQILSLHRYNVRFLKAPSFIKYLERFDELPTTFQKIMLMGHFDNAFTEIVGESYPLHSSICEVRILSHRFNKGDRDDPNRRALETLADMGAIVKVNVDVHARMFIGYHEHHNISELLLGSFDFNRDGLSRHKVNAGIITKNPDLVKDAVTLFEKIWIRKGSVPLEDYVT
jgi:hypothetical protein